MVGETKLICEGMVALSGRLKVTVTVRRHKFNEYYLPFVPSLSPHRAGLFGETKLTCAYKCVSDGWLLYRGTPLISNCLPPYDHIRAMGIGLL